MALQNTTNNKNLNLAILVSVICPVYNGQSYIESTIQSVLKQTYENIEFIIVDGNSTDNTLSIINAYKNDISIVISESDEGMYDALAKGFKAANGQVVCYINAGDLLNSYAIEAAVEIFENTKALWITGCRSVCNEQNVVTNVELPFRYKSELIQAGAYTNRLPWIQQESTFWRAELLEHVDFNFLKSLKYAGDYYLWYQFSHFAPLEIVSCPFGNFKKHLNQLSENLEAYHVEIEKFTKVKFKISTFFELIFWALHPRIRQFIFKNVYRYNHKKQMWEKGIW
jgi:glycosyltransferase involved in cell wall biosynthesis